MSTAPKFRIDVAIHDLLMCGHVHTPATLRRLDSDNIQCQACGRAFASVPDRNET